MGITFHSRTIHRILFVMIFGTQLLLTACASSSSDHPSVSNFKIGMISGGTQFDNIVVGFKASMAELGYVEGKNVTYVYDSAIKDSTLLDPAAQKLITAKVDLIASFGTPATDAAKRATSGLTTPVLFVPVADPVQSKFVNSIKNPGGNITGIATGVDVNSERLELLLQVSPKIKHVYSPYDPSDSTAVLVMNAIQAAAPKLGVEILPLQVHNPSDVTAAIANIPDNADAIFIVPSSIVGTRLSDFVKAGIARKLPLSSNIESQVNLGSLLTYSFGDAEVGKQLSVMADKILKGTKPADLPVETSEFFLAINLKTAQAINLTVPDDILRQAHVIVR